jgi:tartrate dehydratase beta subunit/fumarate hydratase class I family protein
MVVGIHECTILNIITQTINDFIQKLLAERIDYNKAIKIEFRHRSVIFTSPIHRSRSVATTVRTPTEALQIHYKLQH